MVEVTALSDIISNLSGCRISQVISVVSGTEVVIINQQTAPPQAMPRLRYLRGHCSGNSKSERSDDKKIARFLKSLFCGWRWCM